MRRPAPQNRRHARSPWSLSLPCLMLAGLASHCSHKPFCEGIRGAADCGDTLSLQASAQQVTDRLALDAAPSDGASTPSPGRGFQTASTYQIELRRPDGTVIDPVQIKAAPSNPMATQSPLQMSLAVQELGRMSDGPLHPRSGPLHLKLHVEYQGDAADYKGISDQPLRAHPAFQPSIPVDYSAAPMNARPAALQIGTVADGTPLGLFITETITNGFGTDLRQLQRYVVRANTMVVDDAWKQVRQANTSLSNSMLAAGRSGLLLYPDSTGNLATATYPTGVQRLDWAATVPSIPKSIARIVNGAVTDSTWFILQTDTAVLPFRFVRDFLATTTDYSTVLALTPPALPTGALPLQAATRAIVTPDQPRLGDAYDVAAWRGTDEVFLLRFRSQSPDTLSNEATVHLNALAGQSPVLTQRPLSVLLVDLDDDGWQDLLVLPDTANETNDALKYLLWAPRLGGDATSPSFGALRSTGLALPAALDIAAGDLDNNGLPDVAVLSPGKPKNGVTVYLNQGRYAF